MSNSVPLLNPFGGEAEWRRPMQPALEPNLMEQILHPENLHRAWIRVKSNQGAPGIDGMCLEDFPDYARHHWEQICQTLRKGTSNSHYGKKLFKSWRYRYCKDI